MASSAVWRPSVAFLALCVLASCDRDKSGGTDDARAEATPQSSVTYVDSLPADVAPWTEVDIDTLRARIDRLEASLAKANDADRPQLLFDLGRAMRLFHPLRETPNGKFARTRPAEFFYNEVGADYLYTGKHLKDLVARYPKNELADDAAYELTLLPVGGECEGFTACYVAVSWRQLEPFLRTQPTSAFAPRALDRAINSFREELKEVPDLSKPTDSYEPAELRKLMVSVDSVRVLLPPRLKARADSLSASLWSRMGEKR